MITNPEKCDAEAPQGINVYTDGSLDNSVRQHWCLRGSRGVMAKKRACKPPALTARGRDELRGTNEWRRKAQNVVGRIWGGSSTRTELAAGIIAIAAQGPVHIGTDSSAFEEKAKWVLGMIDEGRKTNRPWETQKDGDLCKMFHDFAKIKGGHAIKISKVKRACHG